MTDKSVCSTVGIYVFVKSLVVDHLYSEVGGRIGFVIAYVPVNLVDEVAVYYLAHLFPYGVAVSVNAVADVQSPTGITYLRTVHQIETVRIVSTVIG